jgi:hypothetical protein
MKGRPSRKSRTTLREIEIPLKGVISMPTLSRKRSKPQSNVLDFPRPADPITFDKQIDINALLTNGDEGFYLAIVTAGEHYILRDASHKAIWIIARVA